MYNDEMETSPSKYGVGKGEIVRDIPLACTSEPAAVEFLEKQRWGDVPACPHCASTDVYNMIDRKTGARNKRYLWKCKSCTKQFNVRIGTVLEESRIPVRHWCMAFWLACSSNKGCVAKQVQRVTGLSYKSSLFLMHRIRFAMAPVDATDGGS